MAEFDASGLLKTFKLSIGDLSPTTPPELEAYYLNLLSLGAAELRGDDISDTVLASELGSTAVVLYAKAIMEGADTATDPTLRLIRNTLSVQTKGERYADGK